MEQYYGITGLLTQLLRSYAEHLLASILIFIFLFILIAYLVARDKFVQMLRGFGGIIASFFSCPFVYLRTAVLSLADYGENGAKGNSASKQYLLNKLMLFMQAALIVVSIAVFTTSVITAWDSMLPPKLLRAAISTLDKTITQKKANLQKIEPAVKQLDETWKNQREQLIAGFTLERTRKIEQLEKDNIELGNRINNIDPQTKMLFAKIIGFQAQNAENSTPNELEYSISTLNAYMNRLSFTAEAQAMIRTYNDNWALQIRSKIEIKNLSEKEIRAASQQTYETMSSQLAEIKRDLPLQEQLLDSYKSKATYDTRSLALNLMYGVIKFILLVWLFGLIIEVLWSAINISGDVKKIQDTLSKPIDS